MMIRGLAGVAATPPGATRAGAGGAGFNVGSGVETSAGPSAAAAAAGLDGLLLLQEVENAPARDRRARQHGRALLDALARLQLSLLGDDPDDGALERLAALVEHAPEAADPGLRDVLAAVALRAHVELARRKV
jgi:hypothetical protein